jgi:hypothetical protein
VSSLCALGSSSIWELRDSLLQILPAFLVCSERLTRSVLASSVVRTKCVELLDDEELYVQQSALQVLRALSSTLHAWQMITSEHGDVYLWNRLLSKLTHLDESIRREALMLLAHWMQHPWSLATIEQYNNVSDDEHHRIAYVTTAVVRRFVDRSTDMCTSRPILASMMREDTDWEVKICVIRLLDALLHQIHASRITDTKQHYASVLQLYRQWNGDTLLTAAVCAGEAPPGLG